MSLDYEIGESPISCGILILPIGKVFKFVIESVKFIVALTKTKLSG